MLNEGIMLMATGMGTVFSFLIILWFAVSMMGKIVCKLNKLFPEEVTSTPAIAKSASGDVELAIAIAAAKLRK